MKHIIKVEVLENLPETRPLIAMDRNKKLFWEGKKKEPVVPNDEIWYTSSDGNIVTPYSTSALPKIVSNTYSDGKGVIKFETDVTSIGNQAFYNRTGLASITIPNSVANIEKDAFNYCTSLATLTIPNSVTSIATAAFSSCHSLATIIVENGNLIYDSRDNCNAIIKTSTNMLITGCQNTIIPNSITSIGVSAFRGCHGLTSMTIPNSVASIGNSAFEYCDSLTSVVIPVSVALIGDLAFGRISAKIIFSKLYSTYTNEIFDTPASDGESYTYNVEFIISEIPTNYNISSMLPRINDSGKGTITYNIYTDYTPCKDQALALANEKTIVNVYHIDETPWE